MRFRRFKTNPIIRPNMDDRMGDNINGPSLIRVPGWVSNPLGRYYLYFAHHQGTYIRLAYADNLEGPYTMYTPGVLDLAQSHFTEHVASPDVVIREDRNEIWMYYHGCCIPHPPWQATRLAVSSDGIHFRAGEEILGSAYWRTFQWRGMHYALAMPGKLYRSADGVSGWEEGPQIFPAECRQIVDGEETHCGMRHSAVRLKGSELQVFYSNRCDKPERILMASVRLSDDWTDWRPSEPVEVLAPEEDYEGVNEPHVASRGGAIHQPAWQLRDPAIFEEAGKTYLLYSVAGEHGIAMAESFR